MPNPQHALRLDPLRAETEDGTGNNRGVLRLSGGTHFFKKTFADRSKFTRVVKKQTRHSLLEFLLAATVFCFHIQDKQHPTGLVSLLVNALTGHVRSDQIHVSGNATNRALPEFTSHFSSSARLINAWRLESGSCRKSARSTAFAFGV